MNDKDNDVRDSLPEYLLASDPPSSAPPIGTAPSSSKLMAPVKISQTPPGGWYPETKTNKSMPIMVHQHDAICVLNLIKTLLSNGDCTSALAVINAYFLEE